MTMARPLLLGGYGCHRAERWRTLNKDTSGGGVQNVDESEILLVAKADRRKHRIPTPACACCGRDDEVAVVARYGGSLTWRCSRCQWSWFFLLPTGNQ
jgi:hypothetical protein